MTANIPSLSPDAVRLHELCHLVPGNDIGLGTVAALLGGPDSFPVATGASLELVEVGLLVVSEEQAESSSTSSGGARYRRSTESATGGVARPTGRVEQDAVQRVLRHLLTHVTAVERQLGPDKHSFAEFDDLPTFDDDAAALEWFAAESDPVLAAQRLAHELGELTLVWQFAAGMWHGLRLSGSGQRMHEVQLLAAESAERTGHVYAAAAWTRVGWSLSDAGDYDGAVDACSRALELADEHGHAWSKSTAHSGLARAHRGLRRYTQALNHCQAALAIDAGRAVAGPDGATPTEPHTAVGLRWTEISAICYDMDDYAKAAEAASNAIGHLSLDARRRRERSRAQAALGRALNAGGRAAEALPMLQQAEKSLDPRTDAYYLAVIMRLLGNAAFNTGDHVEADRAYRAAAELFGRAGHGDDAEAALAVLADLTGG